MGRLEAGQARWVREVAEEKNMRGNGERSEECEKREELAIGN